MPEPHPWEATTNEVADWMDRLPDQIASDIVGEHRPFEAAMSHEDQMAYHLDHLYPPQLGGQMDTSYVAHILTTGTKDEVKGLGQALDRHVSQKAEAIPPHRMAPYQAPTPPLPRPPRRY
jgi:hypothetical protein